MIPSTYETYQLGLLDFTFPPCGAFLPKRSMVIKNKRRRAHLARTKRGGQKYKKHVLR